MSAAVTLAAPQTVPLGLRLRPVWEYAVVCPAYVRDIAYAVRKLRKDVKELREAHVDLFHSHVGLGISHDDLESSVGAIASVLDEHLEAEDTDGEQTTFEFDEGD
jgi:hypothetical protein